MATFKVWLATDTPLYLPIYALADLGVLARVATTVGFKTEPRIEINPSPQKGDDKTILHMLDEAKKPDDSVIHIAICDPTAACQLKDPSRLALLGSFIKQPSFWLIGRHNKAIEPDAHEYVYYSDMFKTGSFLGRQIIDEAGGNDGICQVDMGAEFECLTKDEEVPGRLRVLTADIIGLATAREKDPTIDVIQSLGPQRRYENFVTVGIMTDSTYLKGRQKEQIGLFLEAVRSACVLLRTAEAPAAALIRDLIIRGAESREAITKQDSTAITADVIAPKIAKLLFDDKVYSNTLAITPSDWKGAVDARFTDKKTRAKAEALFLSIYRPNVADTFTAEWLSATFRDYGRFVSGIRVLKYSTGGALATLVLSQVLLKLAYESESPNWLAKSTPQTIYLASMVTALISVTWLLFAIITAGSNRLRPISRLGYFLITKTGRVGLPLFTLAALSVGATIGHLLGVSISGENLILAATPLLAASGWPAIEHFFKKRYA